MTESATLSVAAVVLAIGATSADAAELDAMVQGARAAGAEPVVVVVPRGVTPPAGARVATVVPGAKPISGIRAGMALLANTTARLALLWPLDRGASASGGVMRLIEGARRQGAPITAMAGAELDRAPIVVARDCWLELMTVGEQGMNALAARREVYRV